MLSRIALLVLGLLLAGQAAADDHLPSPGDICRQTTPTVRTLWLQATYDAPPAVARLMVDVIDGKLLKARQQLQDMKPIDGAHWRQSAMLTAVWAGQTAVVDGLLDDGAAVDDTGWIPPFKPGFFGQTVDAMKRDSRFGPTAVKGMMASGLVGNRGHTMGPALTIAAQCSDVATLDVLLRHHANSAARQAPNIVDALTVATINGDAPIVQHLLDHGADPCADDRRMQAHKPGTSLASIGRRNGLPEALVKRLACPVIAVVP